MTEPSDSNQVERKVRRLRLARSERRSLWRSLAHVGVLGWLFILPVLLGIATGRWVSTVIGQRWPLLAGLALGLAVGGYVSWRQVRGSIAHDDEEEGP